MDGSSSAPAPHQVSVITCDFADPTSAIMARAHSALDSPRFVLADVCRLRNDVVVRPRELLQITPELHEHAPLGAAAVQIKYPCCRQLVSSAGPPKDRCHGALPDHHCRLLCVDLCVCTGGLACSNLFVGIPFFAFGRLPLTCRSAQCAGAARAQRCGVATSACSWLTVSRSHDSDPDFK